MNQNHQVSVRKKNIALNLETYRRLEILKANLIKERVNPNLTYDDVINILLDDGRL